MAKTIAIVNQKGGVSKSTLCMNLGIGLVRKGYKVLVVDLDPQGSMTESLGYQNLDGMEVTVATLMHCSMNGIAFPEGYGIVHHEEGVDLLPANIDLSGIELGLVSQLSREYVLKNVLAEIGERYKYILIDNMPSLGMLTINALAAADSVMIPTQTHFLSVMGLEQLLQTIGKIRKQINTKLQIDGIVMAMVDNRTNFSREIIELLQETYGSVLNIYSARIPFSIRAAEGSSIYVHDPKGKVACAYEELTEEVLRNGSKKEQCIKDKA